MRYVEARKLVRTGNEILVKKAGRKIPAKVMAVHDDRRNRVILVDAMDQRGRFLMEIPHTDVSLSVCEYCGSTENIEFAPNPFDVDINADETPQHLCEKCRRIAAEDI